mgnify:CR=1 FL=1|tara:strand:+ start:3309 stop:3584 length:276 start_codon:yes stop_codon:yes gene_type:complete
MQEDENTVNEDNTGIYSEEGREKMKYDDDTITNVDEGFMQGYDEEDKLSECSYCGTILEDNIVEEKFDEELYRFCSRECATNYESKHKSKS